MGNATSYILIDDFSAGVTADRYGYQSATPATPTNRTANPVNNSFAHFQEAQPASGYWERQLEHARRPAPATIEGTYGCFADQYGTLCPLPRGQYISQASWLPFDSAGHASGTTYYPAGYKGFYLLDARIISGVTENVGQESWVWMSFGCFLDPAGGSQYRQLVWCVLAGLDFNYWETPHWGRAAPTIVPAPVRNLPSGNIVLTRSVTGNRDTQGLIDYGVDNTQNTVVFMFHSSPVGRASGGSDEYQSWATGTAIPANELSLTNYQLTTGQNVYPSTVDQTVVNGKTPSPYLGIYPDPRNLNVALPRYVGNGQIIPGFLMVEHQGRNVIACHTSRNFGGDYTSGDTPAWLLDRLFWSDPLNPALVTDPVNNPATTQFPLNYNTAFTGDDNPNLIGSIGTMTAQELLVIKYGKGGVLFRGDLNNYEAIALPFVESTYGIIGHGINTPIGWVYGSRNGIFVWNSGPTSQKLSQQIEGFFFDHTFGSESVPYRGSSHRMGYWHPWVCVPNDYLYSLDSQSWWRLENPADATRRPYNIYDVSSVTGDMYGFEWKMDPGDLPQIKRYQLDDPRDTYSWRSHPMVETIDRMMKVEEIEVSVSATVPYRGRHQVTVTVEGINELGTPVTPVSMTKIIPQPSGSDNTEGQFVIKFLPTPAFLARYLQVTLLVEPEAGQAGTFQGPAPKTHQIRIGLGEPRARMTTVN